MGRMKTLTPTTYKRMEERECLVKVKTKIRKKDLENANLENVDDTTRVTDVVYAMGKSLKEWL